MPDPKQVVVIGGGISGLTCAYRLLRLDAEVTLLEAAERVGGLVGTIEEDGFLFESGPQSFQGTEALLDLIEQLGIRGELREADPRAPRFVLQRGRLRTIPMSPQALLTSSLLSIGSRWKVASEAFRRTRPPENDESVANFVRRKFGHEILEYLVAPFVSGVYAGDPERLSLRAAFPTLEEWERAYGSVLRGAMKSRPSGSARKGPPPLCSFRRGLATLMRALGEKLGDHLRPGSSVVSLSRSGRVESEGYEVRVAHGDSQVTVAARAVVMATPGYVAGRLLEPISSSLAAALSGIAYAPVAVVAAGYHERQAANAINGFGFLIPRSEGRHTLGTVFNSALFPGRAPRGMIALTSFAGGATDPEIVAKDEKEIAAIVHGENAEILNISGPAITTAVWRYPKALPQYNLGHRHVVEVIRKGERATPGLFFSGNYLEGPSLGKCLEQGFKTAEAVQEYLQGRS